MPRYAYLAGGTAIAVHLQHRVSRDLDFFTEEPFDPEDLLSKIDKVGAFAPTRVSEGTLNGVFADTKVQFLDTSTQHLIEPTTEFGGIRLAQMPDLLATKLKAIQDRGELRDYFDIMMIEQRTELTVEEGLTLLVQRYKPRAPVGVIANIVLGLGFLGDVGDDPALPVPREEIERYWVRRHQEIARSLRL